MSIEVLYSDGVIVYYEYNTVAWLDIIKNWEHVEKYTILFSPLFDGK